MKKVLILLLICISGLFYSCSEDCKDVANPVNTEDINIGVLLGESGVGANNAKETKAILAIAQEEINSYFSTLGLTKKINLVYMDTQSDSTIALQKVKELEAQGIKVIIGIYSSTEVKAVKSYLDQQGILLISPSAVAVSLGLPNDNIFRFAPGDSYQAEAINAMLKWDGIKAVIPVVRNDLWSKDLYNAASTLFSESGIDVRPLLSYDRDQTDFSNVAANINTEIIEATATYDSNKVVVYMISYAEGAEIMKKCNALPKTSEVAWFGGSACALNNSYVSDATVGAFAAKVNFLCPIFGFDANAQDKYNPLNDKVMKAIGFEPDIYAFSAYDALKVAALTFYEMNLSKISSTAELTKFKTVFTSVADSYFGATGRTTLDANGDRAIANYDFWKVVYASGAYSWRSSATYYTATNILIEEM